MIVIQRVIWYEPLMLWCRCGGGNNPSPGTRLHDTRCRIDWRPRGTESLEATGCQQPHCMGLVEFTEAIVHELRFENAQVKSLTFEIPCLTLRHDERFPRKSIIIPDVFCNSHLFSDGPSLPQAVGWAKIHCRHGRKRSAKGVLLIPRGSRKKVSGADCKLRNG